MSFNFSAMQYERSFRAKSLSNWEYQRFSPPRPRSLQKNSTPVCDKNGHLLPSAKRRDGNFLGQYRGTYHLPPRITRSFANKYNTCLSGQHKYANYPRDLCCCQYEQQKRKKQCDWRETLGKPGDPLWQKPECQSKCEGLQQLLAIDDLHRRCKHVKCQPKGQEKLVARIVDASARNRKRLRKRHVTAFDYNRRQSTGNPAEQKTKSISKDSTKPDSDSAERITTRSTTNAPLK
ncbi:protein Flattop homolog isoform X1 [Drosophila albomicans]|uniref:Cilia- and flagella-associated protein 126 n=1 Tax=Drosophila albomicans TaxID=7291 RepID=A0A6P8Y702_DROAB|nr:protein Flattop homolog isoform X1 [Drosophila albomicans]